MQKNIVIVGYPKSGTTWLSRLVAELVSCPLQGDWGFEELDAPYKEGLERESEFQVYKSHHSFQEINKVSKLEIYKIIYIIRDPRDVVVSGVYYFNFLPRLLAEKKVIYKINSVLSKTYNSLVSNKEKKRQMIQAVLYGNKNVNSWLSNSWLDHFTPYLNKEVLFIKYEDLIDSPEVESQKILNYLKINQDLEYIKKSISNQSFQNRKLKDENKKDKHQKKILRKGKQGSWKKEFTTKEINQFQLKLKDTNSLYDF